MTIFAFIRFFLECAAVGIVCYAFYREKDLVKLERKVWKYAKAFFKASFCALRDKFSKKEEVKNVTPVVNAEFEEILDSLNKHSNIIEFQIAS